MSPGECGRLVSAGCYIRETAVLATDNIYRSRFRLKSCSFAKPAAFYPLPTAFLPASCLWFMFY